MFDSFIDSPEEPESNSPEGSEGKPVETEGPSFSETKKKVDFLIATYRRILPGDSFVEQLEKLFE